MSVAKACYAFSVVISYSRRAACVPLIPVKTGLIPVASGIGPVGFSSGCGKVPGHPDFAPNPTGIIGAKHLAIDAV